MPDELLTECHALIDEPQRHQCVVFAGCGFTEQPFCGGQFFFNGVALSLQGFFVLPEKGRESKHDTQRQQKCFWRMPNGM